MSLLLTPFLNPNSPQIIAMINRNPNSTIARLLARRGSVPSTNITGSNNAVGAGLGGGSGSSGNQNTMGTPSFGGGNQSTGGNPNFGIVSSGGQRNTFPGGAPAGVGATGNNDGSFMGGSIVSFAAGGMMTPEGTAVRPGMPMPPSAGTGRTLPSARFKVDAQPPQFGSAGMPNEPALGATSSAPMTPAQIEQEAQRFVQQHPEEAQKVQALIALAIQTGELTSQELNTAVQLAKTALANPAAYPQIRQFAIQNGLGTEQDIPQEIDQGMLYVLIVAGKSSAAAGPQGNAMSGQGPTPTMENGVLPEYKNGGMTGNTPHLAKLHPREYVIPEDALLYHGKKFFDARVNEAKTAGQPDAKTN